MCLNHHFDLAPSNYYVFEPSLWPRSLWLSCIWTVTSSNYYVFELLLWPRSLVITCLNLTRKLWETTDLGRMMRARRIWLKAQPKSFQWSYFFLSSSRLFLVHNSTHLVMLNMHITWWHSVLNNPSLWGSGSDVLSSQTKVINSEDLCARLKSQRVCWISGCSGRIVN